MIYGVWYPGDTYPTPTEPAGTKSPPGGGPSCITPVMRLVSAGQ
jgi:hypothetical protein